ncbi:hypothetical protein GOP47_0001767 [Adiantum capillus-veneris]|uniref:Uncharacterized protein n=1 Tax=Adiantum capillus-veneris TaxID=13818 RepID=A0A9D4V9K4_ADICA|nr:hypothetical protein GOP47_0001767 [Adiantum capillus-veneris]
MAMVIGTGVLLAWGYNIAHKFWWLVYMNRRRYLFFLQHVFSFRVVSISSSNNSFVLSCLEDGGEFVYGFICTLSTMNPHNTRSNTMERTYSADEIKIIQALRQAIYPEKENIDPEANRDVKDRLISKNAVLAKEIQGTLDSLRQVFGKRDFSSTMHRLTSLDVHFIFKLDECEILKEKKLKRVTVTLMNIGHFQNVQLMIFYTSVFNQKQTYGGLVLLR